MRLHIGMTARSGMRLLFPNWQRDVLMCDVENGSARRAVAAPKPLLAPVTRAAVPVSFDCAKSASMPA
jgi:hypothetical protein